MRLEPEPLDLPEFLDLIFFFLKKLIIINIFLKRKIKILKVQIQ